ncbi:probable RNA-binding protein CG14230 isoform X6 [Spodoptera frugiperda]|uniref:Probable RNA-binding protein CG14230 isoform X2 n=1 Tax=Spodoptera frugiperda TaxID=7108 RepID=A0A9R0DP15_SPOFR|nr:probable RNA-binding protein CG14230 isoform X2 [Spodoptera frugiperda]XP_050550641.1 probable RNA-binding protein CG14230 isoform X4 [Spodoptera frugiperda]XP_050550643.1 probable RNA-binding protein CG14230 isoform X6 [Spodoptera frugiperda]
MISATRLFVGNLPENTEEKELYSAFSHFGEITSVDLKCKPGDTKESKKFAFVSLSADNGNVESCIKHFTKADFKGHILYVTRARESFLERLQRERELAKIKEAEKLAEEESLPKDNPVLKLSSKLNPRKRKAELNQVTEHNHRSNKQVEEWNKSYEYQQKTQKHQRDESRLLVGDTADNKNLSAATEADKRKHEAEKKRLESMKKKRQEFKEKKMIIKSGLTGVDKVQNKKVIFSDAEDETPRVTKTHTITNKRHQNTVLFEDDDADDSNDELNFEVKKQFEGKKGQKVLDLQSRYKSDKRFTLDERFIDDDEDEESENKQSNTTEEVELGTEDEKAKQMNILQDVLGVTLKTKYSENNDSKKSKPKPGMLRFDPLQPEHAKFLAPVEPKPDLNKKIKKKTKDKQEVVKEVEPEPEGPKIEVSKEQFYKVSDALKEAIAQPSQFSLRSLFGSKDNDEDDDENKGPQEQETDYIPLEAPKAKKVKNPLDPKEKNPFVYDSSDSETEEADPKADKVEKMETLPAPVTETKAVWKENLFFTKFDSRLKEGLESFNKAPENEIQKERRELKSLMKKRIYNKDRKNQMFKKKIGGKKKSLKKPYRNKG